MSKEAKLKRYEGKILDFEYDIELESDEAFEEFLKEKLLKYKFNMKEPDGVTTKSVDSPELKAIKSILGIQ